MRSGCLRFIFSERVIWAKSRLQINVTIHRQGLWMRFGQTVNRNRLIFLRGRLRIALTWQWRCDELLIFLGGKVWIRFFIPARLSVEKRWLASTVVDMTGEYPKIIREGVITQKMIDEAWHLKRWVDEGVKEGTICTINGGFVHMSRFNRIIFLDEDNTRLSPLASVLFKKKVRAASIDGLNIASRGNVVLYWWQRVPLCRY